jgi:hypothetical protein
VFMHAGGGTGKTFVTCKIFQELASWGEICHCTGPTGVGASHLPQGRTFHSVFRTWTPSLSASTAIDDIFISLGGNQLKIVVVDEVSMSNNKFLVLLDTQLRSMYNPDILFEGIFILLIGDFIQLPVTTGHDLWSVMYGTINGNGATAQNLFQQFHVHELTANMQAADCVIHMQRVAAFCVLPLVYPTGQKWSAKDNARYKPTTQDIVDGVTHELTSQDIEQDPNWITHHQKQHYVPYYLSIVLILSLKYAFGIISMFFTLVRHSIVLLMFLLTYCIHVSYLVSKFIAFLNVFSCPTRNVPYGKSCLL